MPGHSASKDARERAYVPGIHVLFPERKSCFRKESLASGKKDMDGRDKPGHDGGEVVPLI
jgi:hypothetical protein